MMTHRSTRGLFCAAAATTSLGLLVSLARPGIAAPAAAAPAAAPAAAAAPTTQPGGSGTLADKGLARVGAFYTLQAEQALAAGFRDMAQAKSKMEVDNRARAVIEREIARANNAYALWEQERRGELEKLAKVKDAFQNNQIVAKLEALEVKLKEAMKYKEEQEKAMGKIGDDSRAKYITTVIELAALADKANETYAALAKDKSVTDAVAAAKAKLGPTPGFVGQYAQIKRLRAPIFSETIKVAYEGKVPWVEVTLNGSTLRKMVLDSGSSMVVITASLAKQMELVPKNDDPDITMQLADGKLVTAKKSTLKSVRVGQFTMENVECAILPPDMVAAQPLLGGSFLNNFIYKLDVGKEELHLSRIGGGDPKDVKKPGAK